MYVGRRQIEKKTTKFLWSDQNYNLFFLCCIYIYIKTTLCSSCNIADVDLIERIIISVKYQLYEDEKDQKSELIIEVKMR